MLTICLTILMTTASPTFQVETSDGRTLAGQIVAWDADRVTIQTADGPAELPTKTLLRFSGKKDPDDSLPEPAVWIRLTDGSTLTAREYVAQDGEAKITMLDNRSISLPTDAIASVRIRPNTEPVAAAWDRLITDEIDTDLLVVHKGDSLDYHRGVLRDVTEKRVHFELDGDVLPVKRSKVHGMIYRHAASDAMGEPVCRITDRSGSSWVAQSVSLDDQLHCVTPAGLKRTFPLEQIVEIDFSEGKLVYLSELQPESVEFTPYFGTRDEIPALTERFAPRMDKNFRSQPLAIDSKQYAKGLCLHSRTKLVYRLPGRFRQLKAIVGIDDSARPRGNVQLSIFGDEKVLLETAIAGTDPPKPIELDLTGVRRLTILVDFGDQFDLADHLDLCDVRIIK